MKLDIWPIFLILSTLSSVSCNKNLANKSQQSSQDASSSNVLPKRTQCQAIDNRVSAETLEKVETQLVDTPEFPQLLSQTGCVDPENPQTPAANLIPYSIQAGLWSDGADKERFFAIPKDKKIQLAADGRFDLPNGSVTMKLFRIHGQPVETRFYMRESDGRWSGYSYEWQDDGKDAVLLNKAKEKIIGGQTWTFPSRSTCKQCHSLASGISLGLELAQLNRAMPTGAGLSSINQLEFLQGKGLFADDSAIRSRRDVLVDPSDTSLPIEIRARSYLHSNCASCHRPQGAGLGNLDLRIQLDFAHMNICNVEPSVNNADIAGTKLLYPGVPAKSTLFLRMAAKGDLHMPPLLSKITDPLGLKLVSDWISVRSVCESLAASLPENKAP